MISTLSMPSFWFVVAFGVYALRYAYTLKHMDNLLVKRKSDFWVPFNVTYALSGVIYLTFAFSISFERDALHEFMRDYFSISSTSKHYWGVITYNFSHAGIIHFLMNMLMFYVLTKQFINFYSVHLYKTVILNGCLFTGIATYIYYFNFYDAKNFYVLGLSGVLYAFLPFFVKLINKEGLIINGLIILGMNFFIPNIAVASHASGFIIGYLILFYHNFWAKKYIDMPETDGLLMRP